MITPLSYIALVLMRHLPTYMAFIAHDGPEDWKEISTGMPPTCASKSSFSFPFSQQNLKCWETEQPSFSFLNTPIAVGIKYF